MCPNAAHVLQSSGGYGSTAAATGNATLDSSTGAPQPSRTHSGRLLLRLPSDTHSLDHASFAADGEPPASPTAAAGAGAGSAGGSAGGAGPGASRSLPTFADLVQGGFFPVGTFRFKVGPVDNVEADVAPSGSISWRGQRFNSISGFSRAVLRERNPGRQSSGGWRDVQVGRLELTAWRNAFIAGQPAPTLPPECSCLTLRHTYVHVRNRQQERFG